MSYAEQIIKRFGGIRPMAARLNIPPSTVQSWKYAGIIPARRQAEVLEAARRDGIALSHADFFEPAVGLPGGSETAQRLRAMADDLEKGDTSPVPVAGRVR